MSAIQVGRIRRERAANYYSFFLSSDVYRNGRGICNMLWGRSFFYSNSSSTDPDDRRECLTPYFPVNGTNPNTVVIQRFFDQSGSMAVLGSINIVLIGLAAVFTMMYF